MTIDEQIAKAEAAQKYLSQHPFTRGRFTPVSYHIDLLKAQSGLQKAQALEKEKTLSAEERMKRRKKFGSSLTGGRGLLEPPQTAVQQLLGV